MASPLTRDFFFEEYQLNAAIAVFPNPMSPCCTVSPWAAASACRLAPPPDCRAWLSVRHAGNRDRLFPDVGGGWYLPRLAAGWRLSGADRRARWRRDAIALGLASDFRAAADWAAMRAALRACPGRSPAWHRSGAGAVRAHRRPVAWRRSAAVAALFAETDFSALWARISRRDPNRRSPPNPRRQVTDQPAGQS